MINELSNKFSGLTSFANSGAKTESHLSEDTAQLDQKRQEISREEIDSTVSSLNEAVQQVSRELQFRVDKDSGRTVVTVLDGDTEEVIRQIPSEQVLALAKNIETLKGILFSAEA